MWGFYIASYTENIWVGVFRGYPPAPYMMAMLEIFITNLFLGITPYRRALLNIIDLSKTMKYVTLWPCMKGVAKTNVTFNQVCTKSFLLAQQLICFTF